MADQTEDPQPYAADAADVTDDLATEPAVEEPVEEPRRRGNLLLGILAGLVVAALGVAAWGAVFALAEREYVGIAVIIGLLVGYVVREVSKRSTMPARISAALITALACVAGTVVGEVAYTAKVYGLGFWTLFKDVVDNTFDLVANRNALSLAIFGAAVLVAFLSAGPKKTKPAPAADPAPGPDGEPPAMDLTRQ